MWTHKFKISWINIYIFVFVFFNIDKEYKKKLFFNLLSLADYFFKDPKLTIIQTKINLNATTIKKKCGEQKDSF